MNIRQLSLAANDVAVIGRVIRLAARIRANAKPEEARDANQALARRLFRIRRARSDFFPALFAEPGWDMLLLLYGFPTARAQRAKDLALGCSIPFTTALRWQLVLVENGLVSRDPHPKDARVTEIRLTPNALSQLDAYFSTLRSGQLDWEEGLGFQHDDG